MHACMFVHICRGLMPTSVLSQSLSKFYTESVLLTDQGVHCLVWLATCSSVSCVHVLRTCYRDTTVFNGSVL